MSFWYDYSDGGRAAAGFKGASGDCVTRAIAIATGKPYREVYDAINATKASMRQTRGVARSSARTGVAKQVYERYLRSLGWQWVPCMTIGSGCKVHLRADQLPSGRIICRLSHHLTAVVDGIVYDTFDSTREGRRCVYGYWTEPVEQIISYFGK